MPVRSLSSPVLGGRSPGEVERSVREWAAAISRSKPEVSESVIAARTREGRLVQGATSICWSSSGAARSRSRRSISWDATALPVPADVLVYTVDEERWLEGGRLRGRLEQDTFWVYQRATGKERAASYVAAFDGHLPVATTQPTQ